MSKLNIEIELDWLGEDDSIDDIVKNEIIANVSRRIEDKLIKSTMTKFEASVAKFEVEIDKKVAEVATKVIDEFVNTQKFPQFKSSYDKSPEYKTIQEILGDKLEKSLSKTVDKNGNYTDSNYDRLGTRLDWLTGKLAEQYASELVKTHTKNIKLHIESFIIEKVKGEIMSQLSSEILKKIDFEQIK